MAETNLEHEHRCWSIPDHPSQIEYTQKLLTEIEREVLEGFHRLRKGGVEVGGVLFGVRNGQTVSISAFRPLVCEHALGPGFVLSGKDRQALSDLIESSASDPTLSGLVPIGWYRSNTRSHIHLSLKDVELFEQQFPEPWQIALVLKPDTFAATKAGFFVREGDGSIRANSSYREFALSDRNPPAAPRKTDRDILIERATVAKTDLTIPVVRLPAPPPNGPTRRPQWIEALGMGIGVLFLAWLAIPRTVESRQQPLALNVQDHNGQLRITWNRAAKPIVEHSSALLQIREGDQTAQVDLRGDQLQDGTVLYKRSSGTVDVSMTVGNTQETAVFVGPPPPDTGLRARTREAADNVAPAPEEPAQAEPDRKTEEPRIEIAKKEDPPKKLLPRALVARMLAPRRRDPAQVSFLAPPPQLERVTAPVLSASLLGDLPAAPAPPSSPAPRAAAPAVKSGALIWTGKLSKNDVLSIDGNRASIGALTGEIPRKPVRIRAYPAELTSEGINVYLSSQKYPPGHTEPPAAHNGWNKTSYRSDPRIAGALRILETPGPKNNWNKLVLRDEGVKLSIILIEWELL